MGRDVDHRADLYALGVVFYELLVGTSAWTTRDPEELLEHQISRSIPALPSALARFDALVQRLAARDPTDRFPSAGAALEALEQCVLGGGAALVDPVWPRPDAKPDTEPAPIPQGLSMRKAMWMGLALGAAVIAGVIAVDHYDLLADDTSPASTGSAIAVATTPVAADRPAQPVARGPVPTATVTASDEPTPAPTVAEVPAPPQPDSPSALPAEAEAQPEPPAHQPPRSRASKSSRRKGTRRPVAEPSEPPPPTEAAAPAGPDSGESEPAVESPPPPTEPEPASADPTPLVEPAAAEATGGLIQAPTARRPSSDALLGQ